ncbi:hypothetical protein BG005_002215 [Podila minutissima]|nr:hypothetical protein BG005_002215 [Podila minutissima]
MSDFQHYFAVVDDEAVRNGHSLILCARSTYFERALNASWRESAEGLYRKPNVEPEIFDMVLENLYTGQCTITMEAPPQLAAAAFELEMNWLKMDYEDYACNHLSNDNTCSILDLAIQNGMSLLLAASLAYILFHASDVFKIPSFIGLDQDLFKQIVSS